jgi:hypothetical protein
LKNGVEKVLIDVGECSISMVVINGATYLNINCFQMAQDFFGGFAISGHVKTEDLEGGLWPMMKDG